MKKAELINTIKIEKGQSQDVDIIRIYTNITNIDGKHMVANGIKVLWSEFDGRLLDEALESFMNFIMASSDRKIALLRAIENLEKRTRTQLKETLNSMVN